MGVGGLTGEHITWTGTIGVSSPIYLAQNDTLEAQFEVDVGAVEQAHTSSSSSFGYITYATSFPFLSF